MKTVLITGGTGLVGSQLTNSLLELNYSVIVLTRDKNKIGYKNNTLTYAYWNVEENIIDENAIAQADFIIHLAGENIAAKRWSEKRKKQLIGSRTKSSELIVKSLKTIQHKVKAVISSSAIGWYGEDELNKKEGFKEDDENAKDFLGITCKLWEESILPVKSYSTRLVIFRTGIVLSAKGGVLKEFLKPIKFGVAGILGNGKQIISWIHVNDLCRLIIYFIETENKQGIYNAVAPNPISNKQLTLLIAKEYFGRYFLPIHIPSFILKILLGEMSIEVLKSCTCSSKKIETEGFIFKYKKADEAVSQIIKELKA